MSIFDWFGSGRNKVPEQPAIAVTFDATIPQATALVPEKPSVQRQYHAAKSSHLTVGFGQTTSSSDNVIRSSLTALRARSRQLVRDSAYAKRARTLVVNNVIGSGMGMQAQVHSSRNNLHQRANDGIEFAWKKWIRPEHCHTGGTLAFQEFERALMGEVFEAGEVFIRMHFSEFGMSGVPFALELIESERVPHEFLSGLTMKETRLGVEVDRYYKPVAYWIRDRHPSDIQPGGVQSDNITRVPASEIIHLRIVERWPQTRGVPWLHTVMRKLNDMDGYSEAEITAARAAAMFLGWEESPDGTDPSVILQDDGSYETAIEPNTVLRPKPGNKLNFYSPNRPNTALDAFMRYMLREISSGTGYGLRYAALSGDYSQANYSSERAAALDDRDGWRALQQWFIRSFRDPVHRMWLQQSVFARVVEGVPIQEYAANREKFEEVRFKPRGWSWVDPTKEVEAYKEAIKAGFLTRTQVIAQTADGRDVEDVDDERKRELDEAESKGLSFDTDPAAYEEPSQPTRQKLPATEDEEQRMRVVK